MLLAKSGGGRGLSLDQITAQEIDATIAVNFRAPFLLAQGLAPASSAKGRGRILFVSSTAGFTGGLVGAHHAASKGGLNGLVHNLAAALSPDGVTLNGIAPALIEDATMLPGGDVELAQRIPARRLGTLMRSPSWRWPCSTTDT